MKTSLDDSDGEEGEGEVRKEGGETSGGAMWVMDLCPDRLAGFFSALLVFFSFFFLFYFPFHSSRFPSSGRSEGGRLSRNAAVCRVPS